MGKSKGSDDCCDERRYSYNSEKDDNNNCGDDTSDNISRRAHAARKIGTLDNGTTAFIRWLQSIDKQHQHNNNSLDMPIILRRFIKDRRTILYDKNLESEIDVEINEGVPFCIYCNLDDCSHVGFTISLEQMCEDRASNQELSIDDIADI
jgi:hypothetical protein